MAARAQARELRAAVAAVVREQAAAKRYRLRRRLTAREGLRPPADGRFRRPSGTA